MEKERVIVHVDMDAFFAAVEQRDNPAYRGKPVIVGTDPKAGKGRGVVSTCSYEARKFGVHSAMPISFAYQKCPQGIFLPVNIKKYSEVSCQLEQIFYNFTPLVEPVSIDEAFLDITGSFHIFGSPYDTALHIKQAIKQKTGLTASVGIAPVKMVAKIASDLNKPDGLVEVTRDELLEFLWPLDISKLWGVGEKSMKVLNNMGIRTIGQLARCTPDRLAGIFGKNGIHLWNLANGIDQREVEIDCDVKSVSNEFTFERDTSSQDDIEGILFYLCEKVSGRLRKQGLKGRTITLKVRLKGFRTYTRSVTIHRATNFIDLLFDKVKSLCAEFKSAKVRLVGVKVSNLVAADCRETIFIDKSDEKMERVHKAVDTIRSKFGDKAIYRSRSLM